MKLLLLQKEKQQQASEGGEADDDEDDEEDEEEEDIEAKLAEEFEVSIVMVCLYCKTFLRFEPINALS